MRRILYVTPIHKRGPFGIPYMALKLRTAHTDEANWRRMRCRRFSVTALMVLAGAAE